MDCLIGIRCKDFVMLAADMTTAHSIMVMKTDAKKLYKLSNKMVMAIAGEQGDCVQFAEYIAKNIQLYKMRNTYELSPKEAATFTRKTLAEALRSAGAYGVNLLMGGYDEKEGSQLFFMDHLASCVPIPHGAHGYGGLFSISIMDRLYKEDMTQEEAYDVMKKCVAEVHRRLIINLPNFSVQVIDKNGIHDLPNITSS